MAALGDSLIRLRLLFDYPPPAVAGCRMCWLLVDRNACRVVADLEGLIRQKFEFSRGSVLSLFVEDCYLPHTESIFVVRDNDSVRVKVDCVAALNGYSSCADAEGVKSKKRRRDGGEEGQLAEIKKKKKKKKREEAGRSKQETVDRTEASPGRTRKKKRRKEGDKTNTAAPKPAAPPRKNPPSAPPSAGSNKKKAPAKTQSSSTESSSEESNCPKRTAARTAPPTPAASKTPPNTKPPQKTTRPPSSSSSETDSDGSAPTPKCPEAPSALKQTDGVQAAPPQDKGAEPADAGSEEEIQLVIRRPQQPNRHADGLWSRRGGGLGARGGAGGAAGRGFSGQNSDIETPLQARSVSAPFLYCCRQRKRLSLVLVCLQNGAGAPPTRDYSSMPLLAAPAQPGQRIAFKLLELTENYTPEVSEYKEAKIVSFDPTTKQIELELLHASEAPAEPGKFDLVYQNPDGSERVEYAVPRGSKVTERWESLLEPRLILEV
uniref:Coilin n=1 Tax=Oryzias sinensis TaxID=183150 RepID=A0A8C7YY83_9TELE